MATDLSIFKASELVAAPGLPPLGRGRPSRAVRAELESRVLADRKAGLIKIVKGNLVRV